MRTNRLQRLARLHTGVVSRLAHDKLQRPNIEHVQRIANALNVSFEWLSTGHGAPPRGGSRKATDTVVEPIVETIERYPNRAEAVRIARIDGFSEEAIAAVCSAKLHAPTDPLVTEWLDWIRSEHNKLRKFGLQPHVDENASLTMQLETDDGLTPLQRLRKLKADQENSRQTTSNPKASPARPRKPKTRRSS